MTIAHAEAITTFTGPVAGRAFNGSVNDARESVIEVLLSRRLADVKAAMLRDPVLGDSWSMVDSALQSALRQFVASDPHLDGEFVDAVRKGGMGHRFDFEVTVEGAAGRTQHELEFKIGKGLVEYPQLLQLYARPGVVTAARTESFPEFFYDRYVPALAAGAGVRVPSREHYLNKVFRVSYEDPFAAALYREAAATKSARKRTADEAIDRYLRAVAEKQPGSINFNQLRADFELQAEKIFVFWEIKTARFRVDRVTPEQAGLTGEVLLKFSGSRATSLVFPNESGGGWHALLRWKNHACILGPAWQIALRR